MVASPVDFEGKAAVPIAMQSIEMLGVLNLCFYDDGERFSDNEKSTFLTCHLYFSHTHVGHMLEEFNPGAPGQPHETLRFLLHDYSRHFFFDH